MNSELILKPEQDFQDYDERGDLDQRHEDVHFDVLPGASVPEPSGREPVEREQLHRSVLQNHSSEGGCQKPLIHPSVGRIFSVIRPRIFAHRMSIRNNVPTMKVYIAALSIPTINLASWLEMNTSVISSPKIGSMINGTDQYPWRNPPQATTISTISIVNLDSTVSTICSLSFRSNCRRAQEEISLAYVQPYVKVMSCDGLRADEAFPYLGRPRTQGVSL